MKVEQKSFKNQLWQTIVSQDGFSTVNCQLVLVFGEKSLLTSQILRGISDSYPNADVVTASTAGEVADNTLQENSISLTAIAFKSTQIKCIEATILDHQNSFSLGSWLMDQLPKEQLSNVFVISDGNLINGGELVNGMESTNADSVLITGGLAGDGSNFSSTTTGLNANIGEGNVIAVGFYGNSLRVGHGSFGGWDEFGHEKIITKSDKNILFELDGKSALELYKQYLGSYADELPGSALLFPLSIRADGDEEAKVRTILSVDEENDSMTFAGNMPVGSKARLMKANFDKLINASAKAATKAVDLLGEQADLAILISCVGRKLVLNERTEEELEHAKEIFGDDTIITGFYSYGEISPLRPFSNCELLNQTMTVTTLTEL